jgi:hypothetical protein
VTVTVNSKSDMPETEEPDKLTANVGGPIVDCYPNPSHDKTTIRFLLPADDHVRLDVYDNTGKYLQNLYDADVKGQLEYKLEFDGTSLPAGVYFYRIITGDDTFIGKMIFFK